MKANRVLLASLIAIAGSAFADDITIDTKPVASARTRAEVKAEVRREIAAAEHFVVGEGDNYAEPLPRSTAARSDVKAELALAQAAGRIQVGEADPWVDTVASLRSRGDVKAEFLAARASGQLIPQWRSLARLGAERVFLVVSRTLNTKTDEIAKVRAALGECFAGLYDGIPQHSARRNVAERRGPRCRPRQTCLSRSAAARWSMR